MPNPLKAVARFLALRLAALGVLGLIVLVALADVGSLFRRSPWVEVPLEEGGSDEVGWPHRRGPGYDGVSGETGLADAWPEQGPPLLWMQPCGKGYSGITVVGRRLFTQTQSLTSQDVECRDAESGALIWKHRYAHRSQRSKWPSGSAARSSRRQAAT